MAENYDMLFEFKKFTESSLIAPRDKYAYISQSDVFIGRSDGINEKGLFIAMSVCGWNNNSTRNRVSFLLFEKCWKIAARQVRQYR